MANLKSKLPMTFLFSLLLTITTVKSDSLSFNFPRFDPDAESIIVDGDANITGGVLQLTKTDRFGKPAEHSVGLAGFFGAIHLSDKRTGKVADFTSEFSFVVNPKGSQLHGDGFTFFIQSLDFETPDSGTESDGGFLGLFNNKTALNASANSIVAVEFDSFTNEWDPLFPTNSPHVGIDINTVKSAFAVPWPIDRQPQGAIAKARISYRHATKELSVFVTYPNSPVKSDVAFSYPVDFVSVLSEWVIVGFSAATGQVTETHDILNWSFSSFL